MFRRLFTAACLLPTAVWCAGCSWPSDKAFDRAGKVAELLIMAHHPAVIFVWAAREGIDLAGLPRASTPPAPAVKGGLVKEAPE